jgi:hypothetical protein
MSVHQRFNPWAYEFHPELGYLVPSRQLRQNVRVGLAAAGFGLVAGVALAIALFPRHSNDLAQSGPVLTGAPSGSLNALTPLTASSPSIIPPPAGAVERTSADSVVKQPQPSAPVSPAAETANPTPVETPARAAPAVTAERSAAAVGGSEQVRAVASKRTRTAHSTARRRAREPSPPQAFAASPFSFQTSRFADETRWQQRRRDSGGGWGGGWSW